VRTPRPCTLLCVWQRCPRGADLRLMPWRCCWSTGQTPMKGKQAVGGQAGWVVVCLFVRILNFSCRPALLQASI
jgi:hypothetical protein